MTSHHKKNKKIKNGWLANPDCRNGGQMSTRIPSEEHKSCSKSQKQFFLWWLVQPWL